MRWYYHNPMDIGADLSAGFDKFDKHDESQPDHLTSLLKTIIDWEKREERRLDAHLVTWRGMMTKVSEYIYIYFIYMYHVFPPSLLSGPTFLKHWDLGICHRMRAS